MFCPYCGNEVENDAKFCSSCGKQLRQNRAKSPANPAKPAANPPQIVRAKKRPKKPLAIVLAVLGIAVVTLFVGILRLNALKLKLPDPETFFGSYGEVEAYDDDRAFKLYFDSDPTEAFYAYIELVEEIKGLDPYIGSLEERSDKLVYIYRGNTGFIVDLCESMYLGHFPRLYTENLGLQDNGQYAVWVAVYGKNKIVKTDERASFDLGGVGEQTEEDTEALAKELADKITEEFFADKDEKEETPEKDENTDKNEEKADENKVKDPKKGVPTLPDPTAFFGGGIAPYEDHACDESGWHRYWRLDFEHGMTAGEEYVDLLLNDSRFTFELADYKRDEVLYLVTDHYFFNYTGKEDIEPAVDNSWFELNQDLHICIQKNGKKGMVGFSINFSDDFTMTDLGDRSSVAHILSPGSDSDDPIDPNDPYKPDFAKLPCLTCNGNKDCPTCNGYGKVEKYAGDGEYVETLCDDCRGNMKCRDCGGSGTRE